MQTALAVHQAGEPSAARACAMPIPARLSATRTWAITPTTGPMWNLTTSVRKDRPKSATTSRPQAQASYASMDKQTIQELAALQC